MLGKKTKERESEIVMPPTSSPTRGGGAISVISKDMRIEGDCIVDGAIRIEGRVAGNVTAAGLEVAESGSVTGDLRAGGGNKGQTFVISGRVDGTVTASRVDIAPSGEVLRGVEADEATVHGRIAGGIVARTRLALEKTAVVEGDVRARILALKEGGQVNGTIVMGERAAKETSAPSGAGDAKAGEEVEKADARTADAKKAEPVKAEPVKGDVVKADGGKAATGGDEGTSLASARVGSPRPRPS